VPHLATRAHAIAEALRAARQRFALRVFIGVAELYCDNELCAAREVEVHLKEHDGEMVATAGWCCPACGAPLKLHRVETLHERWDADEAAARRSVNVQRWRREHGDAAVPIGVLLDSALPSANGRAQDN
jgi:hypothetical protein